MSGNIEERFMLPVISDYYYNSVKRNKLMFDESGELIDKPTTELEIEEFARENPPMGDRLGYDAQTCSHSIRVSPDVSRPMNNKFLGATDGDTMLFNISTDYGFHCENSEKTTELIKNVINEPMLEMSKGLPKDAQESLQQTILTKQMSVRFLAIDTPEIPHFTVLDKTENKDRYEIVEASYSEALNKQFVACKVNFNKVKAGEYTYDTIKREDKDKITFVKITNNGKDKYHECIIDGDTMYILAEDSSTPTTIDSGYRAMNKVLDELSKAEDCIIVCDASITNRNSTLMPLRYNVPMFGSGSLLDGFYKALNFFQTESGFVFSGFNLAGLDMYGRILGVVYYKKQGVWYNLNKLIAASEREHTEIQGSTKNGLMGTLNGNFMSNILRPWEYNYNAQKYADVLYDNMNDRDDRADIQKAIFGTSFESLNKYRVTIGDSTFFIPPTSIRCINQTTTERVPLIRAIGTMAKSSPKYEKAIEITMYFNEHRGINGYEYEFTNSYSGTKINYQLNGLNSLMAQFKFCPYLPIDNEYINKVLKVDAVTAENLTITTVPNFPRLLQAVLTVKEFEYRIFMPEVPADPSKTALGETDGEYKNYFAKTINYELMRYYYQKPIQRGYDIKKKKLKFASQAYEDVAFGKTVFEPMSLDGDSSISFYFPNKENLDIQLQLKLEAMRKPYGSSNNIFPTDKIMAKAITQAFNTVASLSDSEILNSLKELLKDKKPMIEKHYVTESDNVKPDEDIFVNKDVDSKKDAVKQANEQFKALLEEARTRLLDIKQEDGTNLFKDANIVYKKFGQLQAVSAFNATVENPKAAIGIELDLNNIAGITSENDYYNLKRTLSTRIGYSTDKYLVNNKLFIPFELECTLNIFGNYCAQDIDVYTDAPDVKLIAACKEISEQLKTASDEATDKKASIDVENSTTLKWDELKFNRDILVQNFTANFSNNFSNLTLNAYNGYAPQYVGGQDVQLQLSILTTDSKTAEILSALPTMAAEYARNYRYILPVYPFKLDSQFTRYIGVTEACIENVEVDTVPNQPGLYSITMHFVSVNRTIRNREVMRRKQLNNFTGLDNDSLTATKRAAFFQIKNILSEVELYPDLELPKLSEFRNDGYVFCRHDLQEKRIYPDPDFYFLYPAVLTSELIRNAVLTSYNQGKKDGIFTTNFTDEYNNSQAVNPLASKTLVKKDEDSKDDNDEKNSKTLTESLSEDNIAKMSNNPNDINKHLARDIRDNFKPGGDIIQSWDISKLIRCVFTEKHIAQAFNPALAANTKAVTLREFKEGGEDSNRADTAKYLTNLVATECDKFIEMIDKILAEPIKTVQSSRDDGYNVSINGIHERGEKLVEEFVEGSQKIVDAIKKSKEITIFYKAPYIELLDYFRKDTDASALKTNEFLQQMLYSAACARTGSIAYSKDLDGDSWKPTPYNLTDVSQVTEMLYNATEFGIFRTKLYTRTEIARMFQGEYVNKANANFTYDELLAAREGEGINSMMYPLDDYYMQCSDPTIIRLYKIGCCLDTEFAYHAYLRNMLFILRHMFKIKLFPSVMYDIYAKNVDSSAKIEEIMNKLVQGVDANDSSMYLKYIKKSCEYLNRGKLFAAMMLLITDFNSNVYRAYVSRDYNTLNGYIQSAKQPGGSLNGDTTPEASMIKKFLYAMSQFNEYIENNISKLGVKDNDIIETAFKNELKIATESAMNDPQTYMFHSYYDMIKNDARGRMLRAFPTFYMVFIDEGRKIGNYKLHDNFYNTNAVSDIIIAKSRKNPVDVATVRMTNFYKTFTTEDEDMLVKYDTNWDDLWGSIYYPDMGGYAQREEAKRTNAAEPNRLKIRPGARIHIRMGYGGDANELPIVFNGCIAEVAAGDYVELIANSDGAELTNPIFVEDDTNDIQHEEDFFPKWMKNINNYSTPKAILKSLLCTKLSFTNTHLQDFAAAHGMNITNDMMNSFGNSLNPFGVEHFGSREFNRKMELGTDKTATILAADSDYANGVFEDGEIMQNIYEGESANHLGGTKNMDLEYETESPRLCVDLFNKSIWDVLHICKNASPEFIAGIAPFGFRSTIFYGRPRFYYAYDYYDAGNMILEKRKPYQQMHLYTSFCDIVSNNISATTNFKTNAVGLYQIGAAFGSTSNKKTDRIFIDSEIYPENQKCMIYDTGLSGKSRFQKASVLVDIAIGTLGFAFGPGGILTSVLLEAGMQGADYIISNAMDGTYDNNSSALITGWKRIAETMTISALSDSARDMYDGMLTVIGDPTVKPYDRIMLNDSYELMEGQVDVKEVVQNFSSSEGYTTTIVPDAINAVNNYDEIVKQTSGQAVKTVSSVSILTNMARYNDIDTSTVFFNAIKSISGFMVAVAGITPGLSTFLRREIELSRVLTIYPLTKNSKPMTAGLDGSKGLVYGSPTYNDEGFFRTYVSSLLLESSFSGLMNKELKNVANHVMVDKVQNPFAGISDDLKMSMLTNKELSYHSFYNNNMNGSYALMLAPRVLETATDSEKNIVFSRIRLTNTDDINANSALERLSYIDDSSALRPYFNTKFFETANNKDSGLKSEDVTINHNNGKTYKTKALVSEINGVKVKSIPFLSRDAMTALEYIIKKTYADMRQTISSTDASEVISYFAVSHIVLEYACLVGSKDNYASSGNQFILKATDKAVLPLERTLKAIVEDCKTQYENKHATAPNIISYVKASQGENRYIIRVIPNLKQ